MEIQIDIPYYDGPALSDSSSLASFEDDRNGSSSAISLPLDGNMSGPQDDDAVTISSHDSGYRQAARSKPDTLFKKIIARSARSASRTFHNPARSPSRSSDAAHSDIQSAITLSVHQGPSSAEDRISQGASARYPTDPSAVFERLRLEDEPTHSLTPQHSIMWIQDQSRLRETRLGPLHEPSDADTFSLNTDRPVSDDAERRLSLQVDHRGIERYYLWSGGSESSRGTGADDRQSVSYEASQSEGPSRSRPVSMLTEESAGRPSSGYPAFSETSPHRPSISQSSVSEPVVYTLDQANGQFSIPADLLVPPEVTACSECNTILDSMRYVCATCGEKTPASREVLEADLVAGKGKGRAVGGEAYASNPGASSIFVYPPHAHRSSPQLPAAAFSGLNQKPLPDTPPISPTLVPSSSNSSAPSQSNSRSASSSSTHSPGYELCSVCIQKSGVDHSLSLSLWDGTLRRDQDSLPSPEEISARRRSAPKQKGQLRHAYCEKIWGFSGWEDIKHDERAISNCSACDITLHNNRYKYKEAVGRRASIASNTEDPEEYLNDLLHTSAYCDRHMQPIVGKWYRCMYCEKDLCEECEEIDEHDNTHILLVFKAIVNMHAFKHLVDMGNPQGSSPILTEPVYFPC
ncbi:hypothetical protein EWM64_g7495 [Hericium alpestre]|uniref:ZZ-type domain-containing protein n=1 Tax=Hericium alpestre TaxID=135208 RepID=A0A4Y9ZPJ3_9AGAM|nr:hypothetical protein EWM64_g7495 [Hericium alpestre]